MFDRDDVDGRELVDGREEELACVNSEPRADVEVDAVVMALDDDTNARRGRYRALRELCVVGKCVRRWGEDDGVRTIEWMIVV